MLLLYVRKLPSFLPIGYVAEILGFVFVPLLVYLLLIQVYYFLVHRGLKFQYLFSWLILLFLHLCVDVTYLFLCDFLEIEKYLRPSLGFLPGSSRISQSYCLVSLRHYQRQILRGLYLSLASQLKELESTNYNSLPSSSIPIKDPVQLQGNVMIVAINKWCNHTKDVGLGVL